MPWVPIVAAVVGVGLAVKGSIDANKQADKVDAYNTEAARLQNQYRLNVMDYQNTAYAQDVDFYNKQIAWEKEEFSKNKTRVEDTMVAVNEDMFGKLATQMTKMVENDMATALGMIDVGTQVRGETGKIDARVADAGIGGNAVALMRGDVERQGGNSVTAIGMNHDSQARQSMLEARNIKATRDTQLSQLQIQTFQPLQAPAMPAPVNPVNPAAPSARQGVGTIALNAISTGINLGVGANSLIK